MNDDDQLNAKMNHWPDSEQGIHISASALPLITFTPMPDSVPDEAAFAEFAQGRMEIVMGMLRSKGAQYGGQEKSVAWENYGNIGTFMRMSPGTAMLTALFKHLETVRMWAAGYNQTPDIQERITDIIIFLLLIAFWGERGRNKELK